jgi:hypothetical protein
MTKLFAGATTADPVADASESSAPGAWTCGTAARRAAGSGGSIIVPPESGVRAW